MVGGNRGVWAILGFSTLAAAAASCEDGGSGTGGATSSSSASTTASSSTGKFSTVASSTSSTGGAGPCLTADEGYFGSGDFQDLCVVARYEAPELDLTDPETRLTWGMHGGPLTVTPTQAGSGATLTIERWTLSETTLTKSTSSVDVGPITDPATFQRDLVDAPFGSSVIGWRGADQLNVGGAFFVSDSAQLSASDVVGISSYRFFGGAAGGDVRLVYSGRSALGGPKEDKPGLYAADFHPDGTLAAPAFAVATWGTSPGPVAVDSAGNVIAGQTENGTTQLRGFKADTIQPGSPPTVGKNYWKTALDTMVLVAPTETQPGIALFSRPGDAVYMYQYKVGMLFSEFGLFHTFAAPKKSGNKLTIVGDTSDRVWVGIQNLFAPGTVFFVFGRRHPE